MQDICNECVDYKHRHLTGYFRDGVRRIDLVLVARNTGIVEVEAIKINFLMNVMNGGLELEIENGVLKEHKGLIFIKIHAPPYIIKHFGFYFSVKKFFKTCHLDHIHQFVKNERDLIKVIRKDYPAPNTYSTFERTLIVYKILQSVPFGDFENYIGLQKLMDKKIFTDLYPLHDGPYFLVMKQRRNVINGRQALMMTWVGYDNLYRMQPIHLIREYFGERMGFLFAFYMYYNFVLFLMGVAGIVFFFVNRFLLSGRQKIINAAFNEVVESDKTGGLLDYPVCPKCDDFVGCPFRFMKEYGREVSVKMRLDSPWSIPYSFIYIVMRHAGFLTMFSFTLRALATLCLLACLFWRRIESRLNWLWEIRLDECMESLRPEYEKLVVRHLKTDHRIKRWMNKIRAFFPKMLQFILLCVCLMVYMLIILPVLVVLMRKLWNRYRYIEEEFGPEVERPFHLTSLTMFVMAVVNANIIIIMERAWWYGSKKLVGYTNNRTEGEFDTEYVINLFTYSFIVNFGLLFFVAFLKGLSYMYPGYDGSMNCGLMRCLDELFIIYVATYRCKLLFEEFLSILDSFHNKRDVTRGDVDLDEDFGNVPCWEREYPLRHVDEDFIMRTYNHILIEFTTALLFTMLFPLGPIILFFVNVFKMRYLAKVLLLHSRRPLIPQNWGLGTWQQIFTAIPFIIIIVHSFHFAQNSHILDKNFHDRFVQKPESFFSKFYLSQFWTVDFRNHSQPTGLFKDYTKKWKTNYKSMFDNLTAATPKKIKPKNYYHSKDMINPQFCYYPGHFDTKNANRTKLPLPIKYYLHWHQILFVFLYEGVLLIVAALLHFWIRPISGKVKHMMYAEEYLKEYHHKATPSTEDLLLEEEEEGED